MRVRRRQDTLEYTYDEFREKLGLRKDAKVLDLSSNHGKILVEIEEENIETVESL